MDKSRVALILFITAGILFLLSIFFKLEILELVAKPMIIPSMMMYYFFELKRKKHDVIFVTSLLLFFFGDMAHMIDVNALYGIGLFLFTMPYLIIIFFITKDLIAIYKEEKKTDFTFIIVLLILLGLLYSVLSFLEPNSTLEFYIYIFFGLQLVVLGVLTSVLYYNDPSKKNFFLVLTVSAFIMSDLFFILNKSFYELTLFKLINGGTQTISYLFYVKYFVEKTREK